MPVQMVVAGEVSEGADRPGLRGAARPPARIPQVYRRLNEAESPTTSCESQGHLLLSRLRPRNQSAHSKHRGGGPTSGRTQGLVLSLTSHNYTHAWHETIIMRA